MAVDVGATLYCTTSDEPFGPVFQTMEDAQDFLAWYYDKGPVEDLRRLNKAELQALVDDWNLESR